MATSSSVAPGSTDVLAMRSRELTSPWRSAKRARTSVASQSRTAGAGDPGAIARAGSVQAATSATTSSRL